MYSHGEKSVEAVFGKRSEDFKELRRNSATPDDKKIIIQIDYMKNDFQYIVAHFILECCKKLEAKCITTATACSLFHKFFSTAEIKNYDPYLIAAASIYLAGKVEDDQLRLRDVINMVHATLQRTLTTLPLGDEYWNIRDAIVQAEMFLLRMVEFRVRFTHPHKYLLHYLTSVRDWLPQKDWNTFPIPRTAWSLLQDLYHDPFVLGCDASVVALGVLQITLEIYGVQLPLLNGIEADRPWFMSLNPRATKDRVWEVMTRCIGVYSKEKELLNEFTIEIRPDPEPEIIMD